MRLKLTENEILILFLLFGGYIFTVTVFVGFLATVYILKNNRPQTLNPPVTQSVFNSPIIPCKPMAAATIPTPITIRETVIVTKEIFVVSQPTPTPTPTPTPIFKNDMFTPYIVP